MSLRTFVVAAAALTLGCSTSSKYMKEGGAVRVEATAERATSG
jgi:hypothetical protein